MKGKLFKRSPQYHESHYGLILPNMGQGIVIYAKCLNCDCISLSNYLPLSLKKSVMWHWMTVTQVCMIIHISGTCSAFRMACNCTTEQWCFFFFHSNLFKSQFLLLCLARCCMPQWWTWTPSWIMNSGWWQLTMWASGSPAHRPGQFAPKLQVTLSLALYSPTWWIHHSHCLNVTYTPN